MRRPARLLRRAPRRLDRVVAGAAAAPRRDLAGALPFAQTRAHTRKQAHTQRHNKRALRDRVETVGVGLREGVCPFQPPAASAWFARRSTGNARARLNTPATPSASSLHTFTRAPPAP
eukprot:scaffold11986_cov127-Isochrysis_galbana.AAC.8